MPVLEPKEMWTVTDAIDFLVSFVGDNQEKINAVSEVLQDIANEENKENEYVTLLNEVKHVVQHVPANDRKEALLDILNRHDIDYLDICDSDTDFICHVLDKCKDNYFLDYNERDDVIYIYKVV